ncbi:hypothetical protein CK203_023817 [Vitis vinifera]|uniref:Retrovirus-related Pol polyprotein from transposon TNT 1-94-like beta-barrel domain-containing protein n=1 Tax=Vitis vinifera TaxID=29760 RepID=A0A438J9Y6_VITVI|nr:hypothetical protein CK203_023817 [Vitis vinifera]
MAITIIGPCLWRIFFVQRSIGVWWRLESLLQQGVEFTEAQQKSIADQKLKDLKIKEGESVDAYFARTLIIANKMKIHGENMQQMVIIEKILKSMTSRFDYVVCSTEESNNLDTLTIDELQSSLLCPKWEKEVNYVECEEKEEMLLMSYVELNQSRREDVWFLDSECSNHMCANKEWFSDLDEEFRQSVKLENNSKMAVF